MNKNSSIRITEQNRLMLVPNFAVCRITEQIRLMLVPNFAVCRIKNQGSFKIKKLEVKTTLSSILMFDNISGQKHCFVSINFEMISLKRTK